MKIALCGSTDFYPQMTEIKQKLVERGHSAPKGWHEPNAACKPHRSRC